MRFYSTGTVVMFMIVLIFIVVVITISIIVRHYCVRRSKRNPI